MQGVQKLMEMIYTCVCCYAEWSVMPCTCVLNTMFLDITGKLKRYSEM